MAKKEKITLCKDARRMKRRVRKTRSKAQWVGFFYLLGTILLAALAVMPTLNIAGVNVLGDGVKLWENLNLGANVDTISRVLYVLLLLTVVINVFKSFAQLGWLYKKKASKTFGLNRNVYAMQKMGKIFSGSFAVILIFNFLIVLLNGSYASGLTDYEAFNSVLAKNMFLGESLPEMVASNIVLIVAVGVVFHLICGWFGAKVSLFSVEEGVGIVEQKRECGRFASLFRNLFQIVVALAIPYLVLKISVLDTFVSGALGGSMPEDIILPALQAVIVLCWLVLVKHATATTEFNLEGAHGAGMKNFSVFIFFTLAASAAMYFMNGATYGSFDFENEKGLCALALVGVSFVMFILQVLMRKAPGTPEDKAEEIEEVEFDEDGNPIPVVEEPEDVDDVDLNSFFMDSWAF